MGVASFLCNSNGSLGKKTAPGSISHFKGKLDDEGNLNRLSYHKIEAILEVFPSTLRTLDKIRNKLIPLKLPHIRASSCLEELQAH